MTSGTFVRKAAAHAAADDLYLYGSGLTTEPAELIKRTFRGVHLLTLLKREEFAGLGEDDKFSAAVEDAWIAQLNTLGIEDPERES